MALVIFVVAEGESFFVLFAVPARLDTRRCQRLKFPQDDGIVVFGGDMERQPRYGVEEYLAGEETNAPQELVWGRVRDAAAPSPSHQRVVFEFGIALDRHVFDRRLGIVILSPIDCVLDNDLALVVQPDVLFVTAARASIVTDRVLGAPDLVVEVLSPRPRIGTLSERLEWFQRYGVRECWIYHQFARQLELIVWQDHREIRHVRHEFDERIVSDVLAAFDLSCAQIVKPFPL